MYLIKAWPGQTFVSIAIKIAYIYMSFLFLNHRINSAYFPVGQRLNTTNIYAIRSNHFENIHIPLKNHSHFLRKVKANRKKKHLPFVNVGQLYGMILC